MKDAFSFVNHTNTSIFISIYEPSNNKLLRTLYIEPNSKTTHQINDKIGTLNILIKSSSYEWMGMIPAKIKLDINISELDDGQLNVSYNSINIPGDVRKINNMWKWILFLIFILIISILILLYLKKTEIRKN